MPAPEARSRARAFELLLITTATSAFRRPALQASMTDCIVEPSCDAKKPSFMPTPVPQIVPLLFRRLSIGSLRKIYLLGESGNFNHRFDAASLRFQIRGEILD